MKWVDIDGAVQNSKKWDNLNYLFTHKPTFPKLIPPFFRVWKGQWRESNVIFPSVSSTTLNSTENEIRYIVTATESGDRWEYQIGFPSLTFQNPEERGKSLWNVGLLIKKNSDFWAIVEIRKIGLGYFRWEVDK